ncbi:Metallo-peptidase family M12-domain-containing protein [Protomyces lactucae-debilis]|uniref:Disintegrin and metalloproteinase domain-containing protein B n=1 Tax=Protomyces lactucae-debilis TaxID=2754530 RepID=A0A1Y2FAJ0_PROLT|nr:Metallo-peptidase family M12-domain-containing protein [Protomyces lactucae-debilis]ORY80930.1 Metallo-peptidase family M12-domain-containing protein [Protomyces lactucae-debilis]
MRVGLQTSLAACFHFSCILAHSTRRQAIQVVDTVGDVGFFSRQSPASSDAPIEISFYASSTGSVNLELSPTPDLFDNTQVIYHDTQGGFLRSEEINPDDYWVYKGYAMQSSSETMETLRVGHARVLIHSLQPLLFEGSFQVGEAMYHVQLLEDYNRDWQLGDAKPDTSDPDTMVVWTDSSLEPRLAKRSGSTWDDELPSVCNSDNLDAGLNGYSSSVGALIKRQLVGDTGRTFVTQAQLARTIGSTAGCPTEKLVALIGVAADCNFVAGFSSTQAVRSNIISAINQASQVYESAFNITLGLASIVLTESSCPTSQSSSSPWNTACDSSTTIEDRLNRFSQWRGQQSDSYSAWLLLSTCNTASEIGVAWLGTLCNANTTTQSSSSVSSTGVVTSAAGGTSYWKTFAHELGHIFGANHDCTASCSLDTSTTCCPLSAGTCSSAGAFLMNPSSSFSATRFSPCTVGQVCTNLLRRTVASSCLSRNQNVKLETAATCGNGIVEEGEDCDCGGTAECANNPCCNPTTCKFNTGAVCDPSNAACCTQQCQFAGNSTICRASAGPCDPGESCSGTSGQCPEDGFARNGQSCGSNGLVCASGQCTSRDAQCQQQFNGSSGACDDVQCALTCRVQGQCYIANQYFISGTPCGNGGVCRLGNCDQGSVGNQITSWFERNRNWFIPVIAVVGGLIVITVLWCLISPCLRKKRKNTPPPQMTYSSQQYAPQGQYPAVQPTQYYPPANYPQYPPTVATRSRPY